MSLNRTSTADATPAAYLAVLFQRLPAGTLLNLGAGATHFATPTQHVVDVDHVPSDDGRPFVVADAASLPFRAETFDGALLKDVLEHLVDCIGALTEVRRVSRADARLVVQVPRAIPRAVWDDPTHVRGFTAHSLKQALSLSGWRATHGPVRIGGFPGAGRLRLEPRLTTLMRIPVLGHRLGTNWLVEAVAV